MKYIVPNMVHYKLWGKHLLAPALHAVRVK